MGLSETYRPFRFGDFVGQESMRRLRKIALARRLDGAFFLEGPFGVGKTSAAGTMALSRVCEGLSKMGDLCGHCNSCMEYIKNPDLAWNVWHKVKPSDLRHVDDVYRHMDVANQTTVFFDELQILDEDLQTALLDITETLELDRLVIFATTDRRRILPPLISRCQCFKFAIVPEVELANHLENIAGRAGIPISMPAAMHVARQSKGHVRDALKQLELLQGIVASAKEPFVTTELAHEVLGLSDRTAMIQLIQRLMEGECNFYREFIGLVSRRLLDFTSLAREVLTDALLADREATSSSDLRGWTARKGFWIVLGHVNSPGFSSFEDVNHLYSLLELVAYRVREDI